MRRSCLGMFLVALLLFVFDASATAARRWTVVDLGDFIPHDVNNQGVVAGTWIGGAPTHPWRDEYKEGFPYPAGEAALWTKDGLQLLGLGRPSAAYGINN